MEGEGKVELESRDCRRGRLWEEGKRERKEESGGNKEMIVAEWWRS